MMLTYFPQIWPDELLYSAIARFVRVMAYPDRKKAMKDLFGTPHAKAIVDLPCHLDALVARLNGGISHEVILAWHTLLPFYAPFLPRERAAAIAAAMRSDDSKGVKTRAGIVASRVSPPKRLRVCPECVAIDAKAYGEPYWHRVHQLAGVVICPTHATPLQDTSVIVGAQNSATFQACVLGLVSHSSSSPLSTSERDIAEEVAIDAQWLLNSGRVVGTNLPSLQARYRNLLSPCGLTTPSGGVRQSELYRLFRSRYPDQLLAKLGCDLLLGKQHWLARLFAKPMVGHHPLHHILLVRLLDQTMSEFMIEEFRDRGQVHMMGPWICLNTVGGHYGKATIAAPTIVGPGEDPVLTLRCPECGYTCQVRASGSKRPRTIDFGPVWESRLRGEAGRTLVVAQLAKVLGVDPLTVKRHAARLEIPGLRQPRKEARQAPQADPDQKRQEYRSRWLGLRKHYPKYTKTALRKKDPGVYTWLRRHDKILHIPA